MELVPDERCNYLVVNFERVAGIDKQIQGCCDIHTSEITFACRAVRERAGEIDSHSTSLSKCMR